MNFQVTALFGLLPLYFVRFKIFTIPTNLWEVLLYAMFTAMFLRAWRKHDGAQIFFLPHEKLFRAGFFLLLLGAISSTLLHPTRGSFGILKGWFFDPILFFLLIRYSVQETAPKNLLVAEKQQKPTIMLHSMIVEKILTSYIISGIVVAVIALGYDFLGKLTFDGRLAAFFVSPNHLAMYIVPAILLITGKIQNPKAKIQNTTKRLCGFIKKPFPLLFWILCFMLCACVLVFTKSLGAILGGAGALLFGLLLPKITQLFRAIVIVTVVVAGMVTPALAVHFWPQLQNMLHISERSSAASRMMIWRSAWAIGRNHPWFGIGPGNFQEYYLKEQKNHPPYLEWAVPQPHNIYLAFWLQTGMFGLAGFFLLLVWFFHSAVSGFRLQASDLGTPLLVTRYSLLVALMLYILLHSVVDTLYWKNDLSVFFWALLAMASVLRPPAVITESSPNTMQMPSGKSPYR